MMARTPNGALWLALVALSFVLLGPVCAAAESYGAAAPVKLAAAIDGEHGGSETACCATLDESAVAGPAAQTTSEARFAAMAPARAPSRLALSTTYLPRAGPLGAPPPTHQSYFARSARILS